MESGLQHSRFLRYVDWLCLMKWVRIVQKTNYEVLVLSQDGEKIRKIFAEIDC